MLKFAIKRLLFTLKSLKTLVLVSFYDAHRPEGTGQKAIERVTCITAEATMLLEWLADAAENCEILQLRLMRAAGKNVSKKDTSLPLDLPCFDCTEFTKCGLDRIVLPAGEGGLHKCMHP